MSIESAPVRSLLSSLPPRKVRDLPATFLREQLAFYYGSPTPPEAVESDYEMWECAETGLQFAQPLRPGNLCFYEWISSFASYYPGVRWEYGAVARLIKPANVQATASLAVLDAGSGKGDFLSGLDFLPAKNKFALDLNPPAIAECRRRGFNVFCGTIEAALEAGVFSGRKFPVVTSFHCLEHVADPVGFVRSLLKVTAPGGGVFVSTPYSPMSFEADWFDVMNHPPHHMTRWNLAAYRRLAGMLGVNMRYFVPPTYAVKLALNVFRLKQYGPNRRVGGARLLKDLLFRFPSFVRQYQNQKERSRTNGVGGADTILVEFTVA
jgi:SAM-dependent methyltransferase